MGLSTTRCCPPPAWVQGPPVGHPPPMLPIQLIAGLSHLIGRRRPLLEAKCADQANVVVLPSTPITHRELHEILSAVLLSPPFLAPFPRLCPSPHAPTREDSRAESDQAGSKKPSSALPDTSCHCHNVSSSAPLPAATIVCILALLSSRPVSAGRRRRLVPSPADAPHESWDDIYLRS